ncbi:MAG TPA: DUF420 domain-containing protein [Thermoleophilia bacterium]|nr:DUF420 domain-containing protein [Thermoleophilia bacterium]
MYSFFAGSGFLTSKAPLGSDISLIVMIVAAILFTVGWRLAARKDLEAHRWVMTAAVILNLIPVATWMIRYFALYTFPELPQQLGKGVYALTTIHAIVGVIGVVLGVFVALRGNELVPKALRFKDYKAFMRPAYVLYMAGTVLGVAVYLVVYAGL